jgi:hypothetical protein
MAGPHLLSWRGGITPGADTFGAETLPSPFEHGHKGAAANFVTPDAAPRREFRGI